ncbi:MAG: hypothetical protein HY913_18585 [Desulfomonile tiedjei]|nr:hypothetical protein [Desulfomonile tiedjei]
MKNLGIAFLALSLLVAGLTATSFAQAPVTGTTPFNYPPSTLARDASASVGWFGSYAQLDPALRGPRLFAAWSPNASSIKLAATANAYGDANNNAYGEGTVEWSTNGLWLGLSIPVQVNERLSVDLQGWYFVPGNKHIEVSGQASGLNNGVFQSGSVSGNLDIKTTWFAIDLEGCCRTSSGFAILGGVRYDYLQGTITAPDPLEALLVNQFPGLRAKLDVNLNSIFPYLGVRSTLSTGLGSLTFSAKGFPWAISVADVHPKSGYFAEVFFSYDVIPSRDLSLCLFAKADVAHAVFDEFSQVGNIFNKDPSAPQNISLDQSLPVTWQQYLIGGVATLNFGFPFL